MANGEQWEKMKLLLTKNGCLDSSNIMNRGDNEMISDDNKRSAKLFNGH